MDKAKGLLKNSDLVFDGLGVFGGILSVIKSFTLSGASVGAYEATQKYGGDAYTGIQNASAQAANNVLAGNRILASLAGGILLALGLALIAYFGKNLVKSLSEAKKQNAATVMIQTEE